MDPKDLTLEELAKALVEQTAAVERTKDEHTAARSEETRLRNALDREKEDLARLGEEMYRRVGALANDALERMAVAHRHND